MLVDLTLCLKLMSLIVGSISADERDSWLNRYLLHDPGLSLEYELEIVFTKLRIGWHDHVLLN